MASRSRRCFLVSPSRNINQQLSLSRLEASGITARALNFAIEPGTLELALWVRIDPSVTAPNVATAPEGSP
ncbi:MAG: hypothetical protein HC800_03955 [Phormidesmis sp. RL_2_1]|nr:hypothetical protein [Phormidesmis sp. RL_2_1]